MESETAYSLLNLPRTATSEDILLAYRKESLKFHPQRFDSSDSFIQIHFKKLAEAYETLIDPQRRLEYDRQLILKKLKQRSRRETSSEGRGGGPSRPGSCGPALETGRFRQQPGSHWRAPAAAVASHGRGEARPPAAYPAPVPRHPTRPRADSFAAPRPPAPSPALYPSPARRFSPAASAPSPSPHLAHRPSHPLHAPPSAPFAPDQYQPLAATLPIPKSRSSSNPNSSAYRYPQYPRHHASYR